MTSARPELASRCSGTAFEMVEHEQPDRRRQIAPLAIVIDRADQLRQRQGGTVRASRLTCRSVANIVKAYAERAGFDASAFSGHSLRADFLTSAAAKGHQSSR
jgi:hypothetical protein